MDISTDDNILSFQLLFAYSGVRLMCCGKHVEIVFVSVSEIVTV